MKKNTLISIGSKLVPVNVELTPEEEAEVYESIRQALPKADRRIVKGEYFSANGETYIATTIIPAGDIINPGTNCEKVNITDPLNN